jgi:uncharacterized membrane protein YkvA (DUF1232 family)
MTPLFAETSTFGLILDALKFFGGCATLLALAFMILLALPKSRFRAVVLEIVSWLSLALCAVYTVSPIDLMPDFIPVIGWIDDLGAIGVGLSSLVTAIRARGERRALTD